MKNIMNIVNRCPPEELYHYTDFSGLNGFLTTQQIWMGDLLFLNDEKEYFLGLEIFKNKLERLKSKHKGSSFGIFLNTFSNIEKLLKRGSPLIFSLTEEKDLLSQWRGYTNNGIGINIGFFSPNLKPSFQLLPCLYSPEDQSAYINYIIESALIKFNETKELEKHDKNHCCNPQELPYWDAINEAGSLLISQLNVACAIIKDQSFKEEKEWRLLTFERSNISFLDKTTHLKPIKKVTIEPSSIIKSITIGPNPKKELCQDSIYTFLHAKKLHHIDVSLSKIPYRN